ncbi:PAP_central domain-containing protein [Meloidogyne graminicola]|uniref:PAP_central domain-containing protein n=1 Tax=Meloidogyne graminicola TaxID=189291 RepID=A0A8S9ZJE2_9BILA|nr:PAP_central domain-containing protein [Meloidogyne graminicola]
MASPYKYSNLWKEKIGGHVIVLIIIEEKNKIIKDNENIKKIFFGEINSFCRPPFIFNCNDNSFYCYLCKKRIIIKEKNDININLQIEKKKLIYTPTYSEQLILLNNNNNIKIIKKELLNGFYEINKWLINKNNKLINIPFNINEIIKETEFIKKYQNYIIIYCSTKTQQNQEIFSKFVENNLISEIDEQFGNNHNKVSIYHIGIVTENCGLKIPKRKYITKRIK